MMKFSATICESPSGVRKAGRACETTSRTAAPNGIGRTQGKTREGGPIKPNKAVETETTTQAPKEGTTHHRTRHRAGRGGGRAAKQ